MDKDESVELPEWDTYAGAEARRVARKLAQRQRWQQQQEEGYQRWAEMIQQGVDAAGALMVETMRAAGWEVIGDDSIDTGREVIPDVFVPRFLGRAVQFQAPGDGDNWLGEVYFHPYSRAEAAAQQQEETGTTIDELAEARAARERAQQERQQQREEEERRWTEVMRRAVDVVVPAVMETLRAAGWAFIVDEPETNGPNRELSFAIPDGGDWGIGVLFESYNRVRSGELAHHAEQKDAKATSEPTD